MAQNDGSGNGLGNLVEGAFKLGGAVGDAAGRLGQGVAGAMDGFAKGFAGAQNRDSKSVARTEDGTGADSDTPTDEVMVEANEEMAELLEEIDERAQKAGFHPNEVPFVDDEVQEAMDEQDEEAVAFGKQFILAAIRLKGVHVDREHFLRQELGKKGISRSQIDLAIEERPASAGVSPAVIEAVAMESINFETTKSSGMSFVAGLPGGFAMVGTIPADITQYYVHAFRIMQKLAYLYGWEDFLEDVKDTDDETLAKCTFFLGVMMGVGSAATGLTAFAKATIAPAVAKQISQKALTKTSWYLPMKHALKWIGINGVTKAGFGKAVSKVVPVVGGIVSAGMTFSTLKIGSKKLKDQLMTLPQAQPVPEVVIEEVEVEAEDENALK